MGIELNVEKSKAGNKSILVKFNTEKESDVVGGIKGFQFWYTPDGEAEKTGPLITPIGNESLNRKKNEDVDDGYTYEYKLEVPNGKYSQVRVKGIKTVDDTEIDINTAGSNIDKGRNDKGFRVNIFNGALSLITGLSTGVIGLVLLGLILAGTIGGNLFLIGGIALVAIALYFLYLYIF